LKLWFLKKKNKYKQAGAEQCQAQA
jgi:hypothetical protein